MQQNEIVAISNIQDGLVIQDRLFTKTYDGFQSLVPHTSSLSRLIIPRIRKSKTLNSFDYIKIKKKTGNRKCFTNSSACDM